MNTDKLRQKILDLAIHGKLVPQDPNDEPASVLLERIKAEKERLIKEGKIKRNKKTTKHSDTSYYENVPFEVPKGWEWCHIEDVIHLINGRAYKKEELLSSGKYKVLRVGNLFTNDSWYYSDLELSDDKYCQKGDLLYAWSASFGPLIWTEGKTIFHYHIWNVRYDKNVLFREYLYYFLLFDVEEIKKSTTGSTMVHVSMENMKPRPIPIPPLAEQYRIVIEIERWFALIKQIEQSKTDLQITIKQTKNKILDLAIHGKLVPQDPNDEPAIELLKRVNPDFTPCDNGHSRKLPNGWIHCHLCDILEIIMGQSPKGDSINKNNGIEFHQGKLCFSNKYLQSSSFFTIEPTKIAEEKSLLLCVRAPVGIVNITQNKICIGRGLCSLKPLVGNLDFYFYLLQTLRESFEKQATGTTFKAISGDVVKNETIALPPLPEQKRIAQKIEELFSVLDNIQKNLEV